VTSPSQVGQPATAAQSGELLTRFGERWARPSASELMLPPARPRLLVSVRNPAEFQIAVAAQTDIIDVKDPDRGPLGAPSADLLSAISITATQQATTSHLSVALGEWWDWDPGARPATSMTTSQMISHGVPSSDPPTVPAAFRWAKLGLSRTQTHPDWVSRWVAVRNRINQRAQGPLEWIAVVYADASAAQSAPAAEIIDAAAETGCVGVLVDTFDKTGPRLSDCRAQLQIDRLRERTAERGLLLALAGRVQDSDASWLVNSGCDIVGVRSAVCEGQQRNAPISAAAIERFRRCLFPRSQPLPSHPSAS
jgi:(5-formylfuran-3-yl)methyl phosphate synthase